MLMLYVLLKVLMQNLYNKTGNLCIILDKLVNHAVKVPETANLLKECPPSLKKFKSCRTLMEALNLHELDVIKAIGFVANMTNNSNLSKK